MPAVLTKKTYRGQQKKTKADTAYLIAQLSI